MIEVGDRFDHEKYNRVTVQQLREEIVGVDPESREKEMETVVEFTHMNEHQPSRRFGQGSMRRRAAETVGKFKASTEAVSE